MRRRVSLLLSFIMVLSTCVINPAYAAEKRSIALKYLSQIAIKETEAGFYDKEPISKDAEEATLQWSIDNGSGKYQLVYYTDSINDNPDNTTKVELEFEVGKDKDDVENPHKVKVTAHLYKDGTTLIPFSGYQHMFPYTGQTGNATSKQTEYVTELTLPSASGVAISAQEASLKLGKNLSVRAMVKDDNIIVWTNQINKGYITDFSLYYEGILQATETVFPGVSGTKISSMHLELGNGLQDRKESIKASGTESKPAEVAGSHPGVKVTFDRPLIREGNKYVTLSEDKGKKIKAVLNLQTKLENDNVVHANQVLVNFDLSGTSVLTGNLVNGQNKKVSLEGTDSNTMALYFTKEESWVDPSVRQHVVIWPTLEESMVLGGELTLSGQVAINSDTGDRIYPVSTGNVALETGYTYLKYTPEQSNAGEVTLQITPYKYKGEVTYEVYAVNGDAESKIDSPNCLFGTYKFIYDPTYPNRKLEISMPTGEASTFMIKALVSKEKSGTVSQKVYYDTNGPSVIVKPYTPQIREVNSVYVIPEGETGVEAAGFSVAWSTPTEEKLKETLKDGKKLYYELSLFDSNKANKAIIAVFELKLEGSELAVKQIGRSNGTVTFEKDKNQFIATKVILKDIEKQYWEKIQLPSDYESGTKYPTITEDSYVDGMVYKIPNSFYLGMRTVLATDAGIKTSANESELYPLTLDKTTQVVPVPDEFNTVRQNNTTDLTFSFNNVTVKSFADLILTPANWALKGSLKNATLPGNYEIYLYQASYLEGSVTKKNEISDGELIAASESNNLDKIYPMTQSIQTTAGAISFVTEKEGLDALRKGKVVKINMSRDNLNGGHNSIEFKGLDPNQSYYIRIRTVLESSRVKANKNEERVDKSLLSKNYGFTTNTGAKPIEPDEEVPPTPKNYKAKPRDNSSSILNWNDPDLTIKATDKLQYEIIRTTEQRLSDTYLKRGYKASEIITGEASKKAILLGEAQYQKVDIDGVLTYQLIDEGLQPNTVYYYYIRTVYNGIYSDWIYQPVTTANIEKPISLKAFNATKTTVDVSFLAKVIRSSLYDTFDFGIAIQGEDSPEWKTVLASSLQTVSVTNPDIQEGYNYYAYRLTGLTPGKRYNIKVCVIDKTKDKIDGKYQQSLYTDAVYVRTEYDQEEQDKEDKYKEFLDKFDKETEKLKRQPYWVVESGTTYKYRVDYLKADMSLNKEYTLVSGENSKQAYYYLPASILTKMNENGTIFKIKLGDDEVSIRPQTIRNDHEFIKEAQRLMDSNKLEDYYVAISVKKNGYTDKINGETPVSSKITVGLSLVYMRQEDVLTEADIMEALDKIVETKRKNFISKLETKVENGKLEDSILQGLIDDVLSDIEDEHITKVSQIMDKKTKDTVTIKTITKAILITHKGDHAGVNGYYGNTTWIKVNVFTVGSSFAIEADKLGSYIFTGQMPLINVVPEVAPYQDFINQYGLTEFFEMNSYMLQVAVTKQQLYGALARLMGASQGTDYTVYLNNKGIKGISKIGLGNAIRQDEAIYIIMQGYEKMQNRKVQSIAIRNRQGVQNIGAFQPIYRDYVYAAVELKVVIPIGNKVIPSKQMTGQEVIAMLYKVK